MPGSLPKSTRYVSSPMKSDLKPSILLTALSAVFLTTSQAAIIDVARYHLGEAGSLNGPNNIPQDSLSTDTFGGLFINGGTPTSTIVPASTVALNLGTVPTGYYSATGNGVFGASTLGPAPDNFGVEIFVNAVAGQGDNVFLTTTGTTLATVGGLIFEIRSGNWDVAVPGFDYIGAVLGAGQPANPGWTSLAVIRNTGISTLYINGVAQPRTSGAQPTFDPNFHLGVTPGGGSWFRGDMDELHIFTFNPLTDNPASFLTPVPEPGAAALFIGALAALARRRRGC